MSTLWDLFIKTLAEGTFTYKYPDGGSVTMPNNLKPVVLGTAIEECGRASNYLSRYAFNFFSLQYRTDINVPFVVGKVDYTWEDGLKTYCDFDTIAHGIEGYWAFIHRSYYKDVDLFINNPKKYIEYVMPIFCPYGFTDPFIAAHHGLDFAEVIYNVHRIEAEEELRRFGWEYDEMENIKVKPPEMYPPKKYYIDKGKICGPNVYYSWVKNYDHFLRPLTDTIIYHEPDARSTGKEYTGGGILEEWNNPSKKKSTYGVFMENGDFIQTVNLLNPAWHCYNHNMHSLGFEFAYLGPFWPWREVLGWFFRFKGWPWEQKIRKSDCVLIDGMYWPMEYLSADGQRRAYTQEQIRMGRIITDLCRKEFPTIVRGRRHSDYDINRVDPGPDEVFPMDEIYVPR